ncbi:MAG: glycosyltransferase [Burkholderiaceae bacterium]|nr:glycosyltransferase [Burkholderiaceae bacterium]
MRIALISEHASPLADLGGVDAGGQNVYVAQVARWLVRAGHAVDVFTRRDAPGQGIVQVRPGLRVIHVPAGPLRAVAKEELLPHMAEFARHMLRFCSSPAAEGGYDVVHANFFMSGLVGLHVKQAFGWPLIVTFHALGLVRRQHHGRADGFPDERITVEQLLARRADAVVAECPQDADDLMHLYGADPRRLCIVPCGVDPSEMLPLDRALARSHLRIARDAFVVLQLGRLVPRKGIDNVVRALGELRRSQGICGRLLVVGGDAAADVFVTTPWYEPFGITPLEAMACGRPVVGSRVGGIKYSVRNGLTGFLVPPRDPRALARRLGYLHRHRDHAEALGRAGLRRARAAFTWERVAQQLALVYRSVAPAMDSLRTPATEMPRAALAS